MPEAPPLKRGQIHWLAWEPSRGSEQRGRRPGLVVQTDAFNRSRKYTNTIVVALSTAAHDVPVHVAIEPTAANGLTRTTFALCEQVMTVSRARLDGYIGELEPDAMARVGVALRLMLSL
jgi:mRNA interferase MazF